MEPPSGHELPRGKDQADFKLLLRSDTYLFCSLFIGQSKSYDMVNSQVGSKSSPPQAGGIISVNSLKPIIIVDDTGNATGKRSLGPFPEAVFAKHTSHFDIFVGWCFLIGGIDGRILREKL